MDINLGRLGCSEMCIEGDLEEKLGIVEELGLWLELANTGGRDISALDCYSVEVKTVQAYLLHELSWLSRDKGVRERAQQHVQETIEVAEEMGARHVLIVPTYGFSLVDNPRETCIENLRKAAEGTDLTILVEPLSPERTSFLPSPFEVAALVNEIGCENVKLAVDTLHIKEAGLDPAVVVRCLRKSIAEVHLKDDGSRPPGTGSTDFKKVLDSCSKQLLCLEFKAASPREFRGSCEYIRKIPGEIG